MRPFMTPPCPARTSRGNSRYVAITTLLVALVAMPPATTPLEAQQESPPFAPLSLVSSVVGSTVTLVWAANPLGPTATAFQLHAGSGPGLSNLAVVQLPATATAFSVSAPPGTYFVRVLGVNAVGVGPASNEVIVTVGGGGGCSVPGAPTGLVATPTATSVTITWIAATTGGAPTGYIIDVGSAAGATNLGSFPLPNATTLTAPAPPGQYFVRIRAINACGSSPPSAELSFVVAGAASLGPLPAGTYDGVMFNNTRPGLGRPPISSFQLILNQPAPATSFVMLSGRWADNAGCVKTTGIFGGTSAGRLSVSVESLACNDGDMILRVTAINGSVIDGTCNGGSNCTFRMIRR